MIETVTDTAVSAIYGVWGFFLNVAPHQFGLLLIPLIVLGAISLWAVRKPVVH